MNLRLDNVVADITGDPRGDLAFLDTCGQECRTASLSALLILT